MDDVTAIAAGAYSAWSLDAEANVRAWGREQYPMAGFGIATLAAAGSISLSPTYDYVIALAYNGTLFTAWPSEMSPNNPYTPNIPTSLVNVVAVAAASTHAAVLMNDGTPCVVQGPSAQTASSGSTVVIAPGIVGAAPLAYQWLFNGTNLAGATNQALVLTNISLADAGFYQCIAGNSLGTVTNLGASLLLARLTPRFGAVSFVPDAGFSLQLDQLSGHGPVVIYASPDLLDWTPILTNPPVARSLQFLDPSATNAPARFYRAVEQ